MSMVNSIPVSQVIVGDSIEYKIFNPVTNNRETRFSKVKSMIHHSGAGGKSVTFYLNVGQIVSQPLKGEIKILV